MKIEIKYPQAKCSYCGKTFTKTHNRQTYCSDTCRKYARQEKRRTYDHRYYIKNRDRINHKRLGTRTIGPKPHPDTNREAEIIQNEVERIGLTIHF
jgi:predicted nucleic acid-binding Zn ribbon protein